MCRGAVVSSIQSANNTLTRGVSMHSRSGSAHGSHHGSHHSHSHHGSAHGSLGCLQGGVGVGVGTGSTGSIGMMSAGHIDTGDYDVPHPSQTCPSTPSANQQGSGNLCYSPTCRSRCSSPCPGSPCGSITPPPPPLLTSSQQHLHSNKNCPAAQQLMTHLDYAARRQSLDQLDSPQVFGSLRFPFSPRAQLEGAGKGHGKLA